MRKKIVSVIAIILCVSVVFGGSGFSCASAQEHESEAAASTEREKSPWEVLSQTIGSWLFGGTQTDGIGDKADVRFPFIIAPLQDSPELLMNIKSWLWIGTEVEVLSYSGDFAYVKCVETEEEGYIHTICIEDPDPKLFVSKDYEHVYKDVTKTLTFSYNGAKEVKCVLSKSGIIKCHVVENGIRITGLKPGTVELTIKAGSKEKTLDVHCVYKWEKPWTAVALTSTTIYKGPDESYGVRASLTKGTRFVVKGDEGGSDGWAYGQIYNTNIWGFVRIEDISTKGTVSQYNSLLTSLKKENVQKQVRWKYPIKETKFKSISSPYGWRSGSRHLGLDINKGNYSKIEGEIVVAAFSGTVVFTNTSYTASTKKPDYGYCVVIESDTIDPVSGKKFRAVYMHLLEKPWVSVEDKVIVGETELGRIGSTGKSTGPHLHFEINNCSKNFAGSSNSDSFDKTINPIFFYLDQGMTDGSKSTYNEYWYNDDK